MNDVEQRVIRVIAETQQIAAEKITACSSFEELGVDSFDGVNVLFAIESEFDINVPDDDVKNLRGVQDVIDGVEKLLALKQSSAEV